MRYDFPGGGICVGLIMIVMFPHSVHWLTLTFRQSETEEERALALVEYLQGTVSLVLFVDQRIIFPFPKYLCWKSPRPLNKISAMLSFPRSMKSVRFRTRWIAGQMSTEG